MCKIKYKNFHLFVPTNANTFGIMKLLASNAGFTVDCIEQPIDTVLVQCDYKTMQCVINNDKRSKDPWSQELIYPQHKECQAFYNRLHNPVKQNRRL